MIKVYIAVIWHPDHESPNFFSVSILHVLQRQPTITDKNTCTLLLTYTYI